MDEFSLNIGRVMFPDKTRRLKAFQCCRGQYVEGAGGTTDTVVKRHLVDALRTDALNKEGLNY